MNGAKDSTLEDRMSQFDKYYQKLIPSLVEFIDKIGISPAHEVLNRAEDYAQFVEKALEAVVFEDDEDRLWLISRIGYFIGEYFSQKFDGCWFVNDSKGSRYYARYVVGRFAASSPQYAMIDPFEVAQMYVDSCLPRKLVHLLRKVEGELGVR